MTAARFAHIRIAAGLSARQLARVLGLNPRAGHGHVIAIERGAEAPSGPVVRVMEALESGWRPCDFRDIVRDEPQAMAA